MRSLHEVHEMNA